MQIPPRLSSARFKLSFPLKYSHAEAYLGEDAGSRTVLAVDAAHTIHPLAGQGLNLGLGDVECLARCISQTLRHGGDIGQLCPYDRYGVQEVDNPSKDLSLPSVPMQLYSSTLEPIVWARSVGLEVLNERILSKRHL
ncbi:hypothetical protein L210DRAFT_1060357 [Boletus edulis BED1]|uniref:FAD-binding domain-containing protein n=1 Tax=Boletus edulis BED1 TaxID=1328754 RepID=A0AAD4BFP8_BOLED|nr:hypothetical protein L210DRAFT_1060357 [Boletus edulis BED1]